MMSTYSFNIFAYNVKKIKSFFLLPLFQLHEWFADIPPPPEKGSVPDTFYTLSLLFQWLRHG